MTLTEYQNRTNEIDRLRRKVDQSTGALTQLQKQLKEYGCKDEKEAKDMLKKLEKENTILEKQVNQLNSEFETKWKNKLGQDNDQR